ncbi:hypothetical protein L9F63_027620, partial [Diploptera punctata]
LGREPIKCLGIRYTGCMITIVDSQLIKVLFIFTITSYSHRSRGKLAFTRNGCTEVRLVIDTVRKTNNCAKYYIHYQGFDIMLNKCLTNKLCSKIINLITAVHK